MCRFSKINFQGREVFEGFSIDRLSQMNPILDNSLFSQKETFKNDKMRSHKCMHFLFETQSIKRFSYLLLVVYGILTKRVERVISN